MTSCCPYHRPLTAIGIVLNVFEAVDVITLIKGGVYDDLTLNVGDALSKRSEVGLPVYDRAALDADLD